MAIISVSAGADADFQITLQDSVGNPVTGYTASDVLVAEVWSGDDQAILISPPVSWIDPSQGTLRLTLQGSLTAALEPARYRARVRILTTDDRSVVAWEGWLEITASPGTGTAPRSYCTYNDLLILAPWLATEQTIDDQAGFAEQRAAATDWLDGLIGKRLPYVRGLLGLGKLMVTAETREITAKHAVGTICRNVLSGNQADSGYQKLGARFLAEADRLALSYVAEIDRGGDGRADFRIPLGKASIRGDGGD